MAVVRVDWLEGRTVEQKRALVEAITEAMSRIGGAKTESVHIVLNDVPPTNWGKGGELFERQPENSVKASAPTSSVVEYRPPAINASAGLSGLGSQTHRVFDLEQPRKGGMPIFPAHRPGYSYFLHRRHEEEYEPAGTGSRTSASGLIVCAEHSGTHIDAICHQAEDLTLFGDIRAGDTQTSRGFTSLGVEEIPSIFAPGVLLDVAASQGVDRLEPGYAVTAEDLERCCTSENIEIGPGDVVLVRTGNARLYWEDPGSYLQGPGMAASASRWLAEKRVLAVGADNVAWDVVGLRDPDLDVTLPGHLILLARRGIYIVENLQLEELAAAGNHQFLFVCTPLKFVGATGSPVRPLAMVPRETS